MTNCIGESHNDVSQCFEDAKKQIQIRKAELYNCEKV